MESKYTKCYHCEERKPGCHSTCEEYNKFRQKRDNHLIEVQKKKQIDYKISKIKKHP